MLSFVSAGFLFACEHISTSYIYNILPMDSLQFNNHPRFTTDSTRVNRLKRRRHAKQDSTGSDSDVPYVRPATTPRTEKSKTTRPTQTPKFDKATLESVRAVFRRHIPLVEATKILAPLGGTDKDTLGLHRQWEAEMSRPPEKWMTRDGGQYIISD